MLGDFGNQNLKSRNWQQALNLVPAACSLRFPIQDMPHLTIIISVHLLQVNNQKIIELPSFM